MSSAWRKQREKKLADNLKATGIPPIYQNARLGDFETAQHLPLGESVYITGPRGVGKTHLVCAMLIDNGLLNPEHTTNVKFVFCTDLLREIKATFDPTANQTEEQVFQKYIDASVLVLDDLGAEKTTDWVLQTLYGIINHRYSHLLPTIITSNLSLGQLAQKLDERIVSRIAGMCTVFSFKGQDRRIRK